MASQKPDTTNRHDGEGEAPDVALLRLKAEAIACGSAPFPAGLSEPEKRSLLQEVHRLRHTRLVQFFVRQIALDIHRAAEKGK
jgi:hypothetical protein